VEVSRVVRTVWKTNGSSPAPTEGM